jgi:hypothetical protein
MRRILGLATALAIALSGVGVPAASADECLAIIGTTVTGIGTCSNDIVIPHGITIIADSAFANSAITSVTIPASVTSIGGEAFFANVSLQSVTFEAGSQLTSIGGYAFYYAVSLTSITIPEFVTSIASTSFSSAMTLTSFDVDANNATYKAIGGVLFTNDGSTLLSYPLGKTASSYMVPASVTAIAPTAFFNATSLQTVTFEAGSSLETIGDSAFGNTSSLTSITIPSSVTSIGNYAFGNATSLTSITIPASITSIGNNAFTSATSLRSVTFLGSPPTVGEGAFAEVPSCSSALVSAELQSAFTLVDGKWNGLKVNDECPVVPEPEEPVASDPDGDAAAAAAREAVRVAAEKREAQKRQARSDLTTVSATSLTLEKFTTAEIVGVTAANLAQVSAEVTALPAERRNQITEILKIARKFEVVDKVASGQRIDAAMLQEIGLISLDSKHKSALTVALSKLPKTERSSYAQIQVAIAAQVKKIQARKDRLTAVRTLISAR